MGYHIREGLVNENIATLDLMQEAVTANKGVKFRCRQPSDMGKMKYQFNRLLRAAQILKEEGGGQFVNLRNRVEIKEDWDSMCIVIQPKTGISLLRSIEPLQPNEDDWLEGLKGFQGNMYGLAFKPTSQFNFTVLALKAEELGFTCYREDGEPMIVEQENEPGIFLLPAIRMKEEKKNIFDLLKRPQE